MKLSLPALLQGYRSLLQHPQYRWWIVLGTLVYLIFPFDLSPDIFPITGQIDDLIVLTLLCSELVQFAMHSVQRVRYGPELDRESNPGSDDQTVDVEAVSLD